MDGKRKRTVSYGSSFVFLVPARTAGGYPGGLHRDAGCIMRGRDAQRGGLTGEFCGAHRFGPGVSLGVR